MNVLIVNNFVRQGSGVDAVVRLQIRSLRGLGHRVRIFAVDNSLLDRAESRREKARLLTRTLYSRPARRALQRTLYQERFDVAYVHNTVPLLTGSVYDALEDSGVVVVQHLHNYRAFCLSSYAYRSGAACDRCAHTTFTAGAAHRCYRKSFIASAGLMAARMVDCARDRRLGFAAHAFIANSEFTRLQHVRHGLDGERIWVLHNATEDLSVVGRESPIPSEPRKALTFVGSLLPEKGVYAVLRLAEAMPDWEVQLIGAGPEEDGIRRHAAARRLPNVRLRGLLVGEDKVRAWRRSFATLAPSLWDEPFGLVVPESYSLSIPVISTGTGGLREIIQDGCTGITHNFRDPRAAAALLNQLWEDGARYDAMRRAARKYYEADFTEQVFDKRLAAMQEEILDRYRSPMGPRSRRSLTASGRSAYLRKR